MSMRILLAGGGTAGHINPALAIAQAAAAADEKNEILFIGKKGNMEEKLVTKAGFPIEFIDVEGIKRKLTLKNAVVALKAFGAIFESKKIIKKFNPDVVVCTGGYVSGPVMTAAHMLKIPSVIHEQNVYPGVTVKMSEKYATYVATSFEKTAELLRDKDKCVLTGNPIREDILSADRETARKSLALDERPFVLAFGGSLGAARINDVVFNYIKHVIENENKVQILFGTGSRNYDEIIQRFKDENINLSKFHNITVTPYIYNMAEVMAAADVVVSRAGAISISEIMAAGKASVLIPSPNVAHNHQETNAKLLEKNNAAVVILEKELTDKLFADKIEEIIYSEETKTALEANAKKMGICDATEKIFELAGSLAKK